MTLLRLLRTPCLRHLVHPVLLQSIARHPRSTMDVNTSAIQQTADKTLHVVNHETYNAPEDLRPSTVSPNPLEQFRAWFAAAQGPVREPEAMTLCTATPGGMPSARMVLLKELDARGFIFYTNYGSRKSHEIDANARAALVFYWREVHKQVRVGGRVERVSREETAAYYKTRPLGSRLGAWASQQSTVVQDGQLESQVEDVKARFGVKGDEKDADIPVPEFWGGWRVIPECVIAFRSYPALLIFPPVRLSSGQANLLVCTIVYATSAMEPAQTSRLHGKSKGYLRRPVMSDLKVNVCTIVTYP
jgi:pyridoxamine-phosphate oxidase